MTRYVGRCLSINWNSLIHEIENTEPTYIGPSHKKGDLIPELTEVTDLWERAGFKTVHEGGNVGWDMFVSGKAFDSSIAQSFCEFVGIESYNSCWISRIHVGNFSPWHWDVNDHEETLSKRLDIRRFHCHISPPCHGHVLIVDCQSFYNQPLGSTYEWPSRKSWHAGMNCGLIPKYLFNLW